MELSKSQLSCQNLNLNRTPFVEKLMVKLFILMIFLITNLVRCIFQKLEYLKNKPFLTHSKTCD